MDLDRFTRELPAEYYDWGGLTVRPVSGHLDSVLQRLQGMTSVNVLHLLNLAVRCLERNEGYLEVGSFQGATLIGALLGNVGRSAVAIDNFSEFDPQGINCAALRANLVAFGLDRQVRFFPQNYEEVMQTLPREGLRAGVYLFDGAHDYRSQLMGLLLAVPLLAERALIVVDDYNCPSTKQGLWDFMAVRREARLLLELPTPGNCHPSFWNGVALVAWQANTDNGYDWATLQSHQQPALLTSLHLLQSVNLHAEGHSISMTWAG